MIDQPHNRGVRIHRFGGPEVLQIDDLPMPQAVDDEVVVRVHAASVNPVDWKIASGSYPVVTDKDLPYSLGRDLAGTIETMGTRAHYMVSHGDRVFAFIGPDRGAQADYVVVKAVELVAIPDGVDFDAAAGSALAGMTAWQGLFDQGALAAGQRVLIHGGAGGVGHIAVQIAKWNGATVFATCSARDKEFVSSLGADTAIDYENERFEDVATDLDLVFDTQGGETQTRSLACLKPGGTLVSTLDIEQATEAQAGGITIPPRWHAEPNAAQLKELGDLIADGTVRIVVDRRFPLREIAEGWQALQHDHPRGKVVLTLT